MALPSTGKEAAPPAGPLVDSQRHLGINQDGRRLNQRAKDAIFQGQLQQKNEALADKKHLRMRLEMHVRNTADEGNDYCQGCMGAKQFPLRWG